MSMSTHDIARVAHEVNRAYCRALGDTSHAPWEATSSQLQASVVAGVVFVANNPEASASAGHESWLAYKLAEGWCWGEVKNEATKEHPNMVEYYDLPLEERAKDHIFRAIVLALTPAN
jgi:RyR domain